MGSINDVDATETPTTRPGNLFAERFSDNFHKNSNTGYHVPTTVLGASENRKIKVITIGGGFSGVMLAYYLERELRNVEHVIYEKNPEIGGTWVSVSSCVEEYHKGADGDAMVVQ